MKMQLRAYRTLVRIRIQRQEALDRERTDAQAELARLGEAARETAQAFVTAQESVTGQVALLDRLTRSGNRFQIADYLAQQDYHASLEELAGQAHAENAKADAAVAAQQEVLRQARSAASMNLRQRERLEEKIRLILVQLDVAQMDAEDEEAEETVVTRKLGRARAKSDAARNGHA